MAEAAQRRPSARETIAVYLQPRVLIVAALGFAAGLPLALSGATLTVRLADHGVDLGTIGLLSLAGLPYTFKFLWAALVDAADVPVLGRRLGRRRGWLLASQLALLAAIVFLATRDPAAATLSIGLGALLVATASATQDIVIDAFRIESLDPDQQAAGMASYVATYRIGMLVSGAGVIGVTAWLEANGFGKGPAWTIAFILAGVALVIGMIATLLSREPRQASAPIAEASAPAATGNLLSRFLATSISAFTSFLTREGAIVALLFVLLYKLCDAVAGVMTGPFVLSLGYDKATYAGIVKGVGLAATLVGGFAGGLVARALPLVTALWLGAFLQMASNLAFVWLGAVPPSTAALTATIVAENLSGGIGTVIFVAYLSALCSSPAHTATHYALLTALASTGRTFIAAFSGYAAKSLGWPMFFLATVILALPSLAVLLWLSRRGHFAGLSGERTATS